MTRDQLGEVAEWTERLIAQQISEQEMSQLEKSLLASEEARQLYLDLTRHHSFLQSTDLAGEMIPSKLQRSKVLWYRFGLVVTTVAALVAILFSLKENDLPREDPMAQLLGSSSAKWGKCDLPTGDGAKVGSGIWELLEGTAMVKMESGVMVNLEGPVRFEIKDSMHTLVHYGTAVADVPEQASGFRMDTPDMQITDIGTVFAVSVPSEGESSVLVLDGEVEVLREGNTKKELLRADDDQAEFEKQVRTPVVMGSELRLSQGEGDWTTVIANDSANHLKDGLLLVKNPIPEAKIYARKAYMRFDLKAFSLAADSEMQLILHQAVSPIGFASRVPDSRFFVYALKDEKEWDAASIKWGSAPSNNPNSPSGMKDEEVIQVGTFVIPSGQQQGTLEIDLKNIPSDERRFLTLIITRETPSSGRQGLAHAFYAGSHPSGLEPRLRVNFK